MQQQQFDQHVLAFFSDDPVRQIQSTHYFRRIFSGNGNNRRITQEIPGVLIRLVEFLHFDHIPRLQLEALILLSNVTTKTSEDTAAVIDHGAVPIFVDLLKSKVNEIREPAVWALGNIAGENTKCRNVVLESGALDNILPLCDINMCTPTQVWFLRSVIWCLTNLCRRKPCPEWKYGQLIIKGLSMAMRSQDIEATQTALWGFSYLADDGNNKVFRAMKDNGSLNWVVSSLDHASYDVRHAALRCIGSVMIGCDEQVQYLLRLGVLEGLRRMMTSDKPLTKREAIWALANVTAGTEEHIEEVIAGNVFPTLINALETEEYEIYKESMYAVCNALSGSNVAQSLRILGSGVLPPFIRRLKTVPSRKLRNESISSVVWMWRPINFLLCGYSSYHCDFHVDIPYDVLGTIMRFISGSPGISIRCGISIWF